MSDPPTKTCPGCGCIFIKRRDESTVRWIAHKTCSIKCSNSSRKGGSYQRRVDPDERAATRRSRCRIWSEAEVNILRSGYENNFSIEAIGACLPGRAHHHIRQKANQLLLCFGQSQTKPTPKPAAEVILPSARILDLAARGIGAHRIVPMLAHDFPGLKYRDVQAVLDRKA